MDVKDLFQPEHVIVDNAMTTKKQVLEELSVRASDIVGIEKRTIFEGLLERERLGSTGVGHGIAIPHTKLETLETIFCMFLKLLAPTSAGADHLKVLQRLSRVLRDEERCGKMRAETEASKVYHLLTSPTPERPHAAGTQNSHSVP